MKPVKKKNNKWVKNKNNLFLITLILLIIITLLLVYFNVLYIDKLSITQYFAGIAGTVTLIVLIYRTFQTEKQIKQTQHQIEKQEKTNEERFELTRKQIQTQVETKKDQQFLDAVKLIEENKSFGSLKAGLGILHNLAIQYEEDRQKILDYLDSFNIKLKPIVSDMKFDSVFNYDLKEKYPLIRFNNIVFHDIEIQRCAIHQIRGNDIVYITINNETYKIENIKEGFNNLTQSILDSNFQIKLVAYDKDEQEIIFEIFDYRWRTIESIKNIFSIIYIKMK